jgi:hypothetical protein
MMMMMMTMMTKMTKMMAAAAVAGVMLTAVAMTLQESVMHNYQH